MDGDALRSSLKHVYYLTNVQYHKSPRDVILGIKFRCCSVYKITGQNRRRIDENFTDFSCFIFQFGEVEALFGGLRSQKPLVVTGTEFWPHCESARYPN